MNTFLQLRQKTAEVVNGNGDFITKLKKPITLFEGDTVNLNKAIIDSRAADSGKIDLENDLQLDFNFYYYLINADPLGKEDLSGNAWTTASIDAEPYILSQSFSHTTGSVQELNQIEIKYTAPRRYEAGPETLLILYEFYPVGSTIPIPYPLTLNYVEPPSGTLYPFNVTYAASNLGINAQVIPGQATFKRLSTDQDIIVQGGNDLPKSGFLLDTLTLSIADVPGTDEHYEPVLGTKSVYIKSGSYDTNEITQRINQQLTSVSIETTFTNTSSAAINPFLLSTNDALYLSLNTPLFIRYDGDVNAADGGSPYKYKGVFKYESQAKNYLFGASQMDLFYDGASNRFEWNFKHMPLYKNGDIITTMVEIGATIPKTKYKMANANGGVVFQSLTSRELINGVLQPTSTNFWSNTLGFDLGTLCVTPNHITSPILTRVPKFSRLTLGSSITGGELGIDMFLDKTAAPTALDFSGINPIVGGSTIPIVAAKDFELLNVTTGYFLIEIQGLNNEMITNTDIKSHVFGIVTRYYQAINYTTGSEQDAIVYRHSGAPLYLNELKIRILNSDYELPDVGPDNSLFLQVINQPRPLALENKKK
jgi:hypothetical protein